MSEPYVIVFGMNRKGDECSECTLSPKDFGKMARQWAERFKDVPCTETAQVFVCSMPKAKWDGYKDVDSKRVEE